MTPDDVIGPWDDSKDLTSERLENIRMRLIPAVNALEARMLADGFVFPVNPLTKTGVSGQTFGGFRPQECPCGAAKSNHKIGLAVDRYDPQGGIDAWCMKNLPILAECGIWLEHPDSTKGWSHWQCVPPKSGRRVFMP